MSTATYTTAHANGMYSYNPVFHFFNKRRAVTTEHEEEIATESPRQFSTGVLAYLENKYGSEYALADELGFAPSYMGVRADFNHIF